MATKKATKTPATKSPSAMKKAAKTPAKKSAAKQPAKQAAKPEPTHHDIAIRAEQLWQERGRPHGSSDVDWHRAEQEFKA